MPLLLSETQFFIWDTVGGVWNRTAVLNPFWFIHLIENFMNAKSRLSGKYLHARCLPNMQRACGSSRAMVRTFLGKNQWGTCSKDPVVLKSRGYTVMEPWWSHFYFKYLLCREIIGIGSREASGKHVAWPPAVFSFSLFQLVTLQCSFFLSNPDMLCLPGCPVPSLAL